MRFVVVGGQLFRLREKDGSDLCKQHKFAIASRHTVEMQKIYEYSRHCRHYRHIAENADDIGLH